jgi:hypothetical protein
MSSFLAEVFVFLGFKKEKLVGWLAFDGDLFL